MTPFIVLVTLLILTVCILTVGFLVFVLDALIRGHDLPTSRQARRRLANMLSEYADERKVFYDLGCGRGTLALFVKHAFPQFDVYGLDKSRIRIVLAKLKAFLLRRKAIFVREDILQADLGRADIVYLYVWYELMPQLETKLLRELKRGAIVIANTVRFPNWRPVRTLTPLKRSTGLPDHETLFVYMRE